MPAQGADGNSLRRNACLTWSILRAITTGDFFWLVCKNCNARGDTLQDLFDSPRRSAEPGLRYLTQQEISKDADAL
jgi:hypothetical protein